MPNYWLDLYTGNTWEAFKENGASVTGFRERWNNTVKKLKCGDYLLCYITGVSRFIAVLEVTSPMFIDRTTIWDDEDFPCRVGVKVVCELEPDHSIPIKSLRDKLSIFKGLKSPNAWSAFFRSSLRQFSQEDGKAIYDSIVEGKETPRFNEVDPKKWGMRPKMYGDAKGKLLTVPDEEEEANPCTPDEKVTITHEEIQWLLLKLGSDMGLDVWVARNDKNKSFDGNGFKDISNIRDSLPVQFDAATNRTIELIDVLWLDGDAILAAFEVEHTTSIYSGLLRMSDLVSMQPNIKLDLYIVAPDERRSKVYEEINRPTFSKLKRPLPEICRFIPYSELKREIENIGDKIHYMRPEFIKEIAEECIPNE